MSFADEVKGEYAFVKRMEADTCRLGRKLFPVRYLSNGRVLSKPFIAHHVSAETVSLGSRR